MTKVRKQKRKEQFRYNVNRKRLRNKLKKGPSINSKEIMKEWVGAKSAQSNMMDMGLVYDVNKAFTIPSAKESLQAKPSKRKNKKVKPTAPSKIHVMMELEVEANAPRVRKLRLPNNQVTWLTYLISKYDDDYKSMARDPKNYYQETWKQIRAKIRTFQGIPEQYEQFLNSLST